MKFKLLILALICAFALTACKGSDEGSGTTQNQSASGSPENTADTSSGSPGTPDDASGEDDSSPGVTDDEPDETEYDTDDEYADYPEVDNSETELRAIYQEYGDGDIVEILQFSYNGLQDALEEYNWRNPELELLNNEISAGPLRIYQEFMDGQLENKFAQNIDIRSYAFESEDLLQVVTTCVVYPETMPSLYTKVWSYNFYKSENTRIQLEDALFDYGLTNDDMEQIVMENYTPQNNETVLSVETAGFVIDQTPATPVTRFLLTVTIEYDSDPAVSFFMYTPESNELTELDSTNMFDPVNYSLAELDPPLLHGGSID